MRVCRRLSLAITIAIDINMRTVQMTLDTKLVKDVDRAAKRLRLTRSAFARRALAAEVERLRIEELERRHREGYLRHPVEPGEFDWPEDEGWPDDDFDW